jgi:protein gp37
MWAEVLKWDEDAGKAKERRRVFCASMGDVFESHRDASPLRARLWDVIRRTRNLDWLLLTKRPENIVDKLPPDWGDGWPHVWLGVSVENQQWAGTRIGILLKVPTRVRFVSAEPLLGAVDFTRLGANAVNRNALTGMLDGPVGSTLTRDSLPGIDWIIVGGESGYKARIFELNWAREIVEQCKAAGVACFVKQLGARPMFDRDEARIFFQDKKGGDIEEFPEDLRVRQFPKTEVNFNV